MKSIHKTSEIEILGGRLAWRPRAFGSPHIWPGGALLSPHPDGHLRPRGQEGQSTALCLYTALRIQCIPPGCVYTAVLWWTSGSLGSEGGSLLAASSPDRTKCTNVYQVYKVYLSVGCFFSRPHAPPHLLHAPHQMENRWNEEKITLSFSLPHSPQIRAKPNPK